jgi:hypothetical protein
LHFEAYLDRIAQAARKKNLWHRLCSRVLSGDVLTRGKRERRRDQNGNGFERRENERWRVFSGQERRQMLHDDVEAGVTISLLLTGVIFAGLVLMLIGVTLSL